MSALTVQDLSVIEGDARISDKRLMNALGYSEVGNVHNIIRRHWDELEEYGEVFAQMGKNPSAKGGRPTTTFYLNEHQTVAICMWSQTKKARQVRVQVVKVFVAHRNGDLQGLATENQKSDVFEQAAARARASADHFQALGDMNDFAFRLAHMPIWKNGRRPRWWFDLEVRSFLAVTHRQMSIIQAEAIGRERYGSRSPSKSAIGEFWLRLDAAVGLSIKRNRTSAAIEQRKSA